MDDEDCTPLHETAAAIRTRITGVLDDLGSTAAEIARQFAEVTAREPLRRSDVTAIQPVLRRVLEDHRGLVQGVGLGLDTGHLSDATRWLEWWGQENNGAARFARHHLDPMDSYYYDYTSRDWFAGPRESRQPTVTGPFVDFAGTNEHIVTLGVPVAHADDHVDVVGADLPVAVVERLLIGSLRSRSPHTLLLNNQGRVVASTSSQWWSGTLFRGADPEPEAIALGGPLHWRLITVD